MATCDRWSWIRWIIPAVLVMTLALVRSSVADEPVQLTPEQFEADFDALWTSIGRSYAYFDSRQTDWDAVRTIYRPRARQVKTRAEFVGLLEAIIEELYDAHAHLNTNTASSPRLVPSGADIWGEWRGDDAIIAEVRPGSAAAKAGLQPGMTVVSYNGSPISKLVAERLGRSLRRPDPAARDWALRVILAGRHNENRRIGIHAGEGDREVALDDSHDRVGARGSKPLESRKLASNVGYVRLHDSLGNNETVAAFDLALEDLKDTGGLILDLRDTPSGGTSSVARGVMGRLVSREAPYQKHALPEEERETGIKRSWLELVSPRGPFIYQAPVIVLVDHWTGSMGEGIAIGLDATRRGRVVGTPMARLLGAKMTETLPNSHIQVSFPAEKLFHVDGTPREAYRPKVEVDLPKAEGADPILEAGLNELARMPR